MNKLGTVAVLPDTHCGALTGLTPIEFDARPDDTTSAAHALYLQRREFYNWFDKEVTALGPIDGLIGLGDLIEGTGYRNSGQDCLTTDRVIQIKMATRLIRKFATKNIFLVRGTPYHTGDAEDWEDVVADFVDAGVEDNVFLDIHGHIVYCRHKIGKSGAPNGWATAPAREATWNLINSVTQKHPNADLQLYGHIHEYTVVSKWGKTVVTSPALQLPGTSYGKRQMSGNYDVGFLLLHFFEGDKFEVEPRLIPNEVYAPKVVSFV